MTSNDLFCGVYSMIQIANPFASRSNRSVTPPPNIRVIRDIPRRPTAIVSCCPLRASSRIFAATSSSWPNFKDTQLVSKPHCSSVSQAFLRTEHSASRSFRIHVSRSSRRRALNCSSTAGFSDPPCSNRTRGIGFNTWKSVTVTSGVCPSNDPTYRTARWAFSESSMASRRRILVSDLQNLRGLTCSANRMSVPGIYGPQSFGCFGYRRYKSARLAIRSVLCGLHSESIKKAPSFFKGEAFEHAIFTSCLDNVSAMHSQCFHCLS